MNKALAYITDIASLEIWFINLHKTIHHITRLSLLTGWKVKRGNWIAEAGKKVKRGKRINITKNFWIYTPLISLTIKVVWHAHSIQKFEYTKLFIIVFNVKRYWMIMYFRIFVLSARVIPCIHCQIRLYIRFIGHWFIQIWNGSLLCRYE